MPITPTSNIWMNGEMVPWEDAKIHVLTHTLHYGTGVFEGIRAYETDEGPAIFRLTEHIERLYNSAKILNMPMPYSVGEIVQACKDVVADSGLDACYVRPIAYYGYGEMGLATAACTTDISIAAWPWGAYLGDDAVTKGVRLKISSWTRHDHNIMPPASKTTGNYANSTLAKMEAMRAGYDEAVMLNNAGLVSECSGENIFVVRDGEIATPPMGVSILGGITRNSVMRVMRELGLTVHERLISRDERYIADEVFMVGTAAEVTPVRELDDRAIGAGARGPITEKVQNAYFDAVRGVKVPDDTWLAIV